MPEIVLDLGTITIQDNTPESGKLTQQNFKDWLDNQFNKENAGGAYPARMIAAVRRIGIMGVQARAAAYVNQQARQAVTTVPPDIITEEV